jgi:hypothetical protein
MHPKYSFGHRISIPNMALDVLFIKSFNNVPTYLTSASNEWQFIIAFCFVQRLVPYLYISCEFNNM